MLLTKIDFDLSEGAFQYNENGQMVDATKVVLHAPSMQDIQTTTKLKQLILKAQLGAYKMMGQGVVDSAKEQQQEKEEDDKAPSGILMSLYMGDVDVNDIFELFKDLVLNTGKATINNTKTNLNKAMISQMKLDEFESMVDCYLSTFINAS